MNKGTKHSAAVATTSKLQSGAAGAGGGTLLVLLANNLPQGHPWKSWLLLIAPSASVAIAVLAAWTRRYLETLLNRRELKSLILQSKETLRAALNNDQTSPEHKAELRKHLEELESLLVERDLERIKALSLDTSTPPVA
jgi:hypothetical protein